MLPVQKRKAKGTTVDLDRAAQLAHVRVEVALSRYEALLKNGAKWQPEEPATERQDTAIKRAG